MSTASSTETREPQTIEGQIEQPQKQDALATQDSKAISHIESHGDPFIAIIERLALQPNFDVNALDKLLSAKERWDQGQAQKSFDIAMADFKKTAPEIIRNREVSYPTKSGGTTAYTHATLDAVCDVLVAALSERGFRHRWVPHQPDKSTVQVTCVIRHRDGGFEETTISGPPDDSGGKNAIQAVGSTVTYLERYTLLAACGLAVKGQDTDGTTKPNLSEVGCPACGNIGAIIVGKPEYGGGYVCFKKKGGCGAKFEYLPGEEPKPQLFTGKVIALKNKKSGGKVVAGEIRIHGHNCIFLVKDDKLWKRVLEVPGETLKNVGLTLEAIEHAGKKDDIFWEVLDFIVAKTEGQQQKPESELPREVQKVHDAIEQRKVAEAQTSKAGNPPSTEKPPTITEQDVKMMKGRGKAKTEVIVRWKRLVGKVQQVSSVLTTKNKSKYMQVLIAGLQPLAEKPDATYTPYNMFRTFHASLFEVLALSPGKSIDMLYSLDLREGVTFQMVEEVLFMGGQKYVDGMAEIPTPAVDLARNPPSSQDSASPSGLFEEEQ